mmetsp:Transcript_33538/g.90773  ORF Transcript_33538/g.90773 Transcript_33538/m.90773 type:complete len:210 (-) Transcript_33538:61-690(-)
MIGSRRSSGGSLASGGVSRAAGDLPGGLEMAAGGARMNMRAINTILYQNPGAKRVSQHVVPWNRQASAPPPRRLTPDAVAEMPAWIRAGAHLCYRSRSSGKTLEVIVEKVSQMKQEVKITFVEDPDVWKGIPFTMVLSRANPLLGPWNAEEGASRDPQKQLLESALRTEPDKAELIRRLRESEAEAGQAGEGDDDEVEVVQARSRSRSR